MKSLVSLILILSLCSLSASERIKKEPTDHQAQPSMAVGFIIGITVVVVAGTATYIIWRAKKVASIVLRCSNCSRLLPVDATTCPICGESVGSSSQSRSLVEGESPAYETVVQSAEMGIEWQDLVKIPTNMQGAQLDGEIELSVVEGESGLTAWATSNGVDLASQTISVGSCPTNHTSFFRLIERNLP